MALDSKKKDAENGDQAAGADSEERNAIVDMLLEG